MTRRKGGGLSGISNSIIFFTLASSYKQVQFNHVSSVKRIGKLCNVTQKSKSSFKKFQKIYFFTTNFVIYDLLS